MNRRVLTNIKWFFSYMASILMYATIVILVLIGLVLLAYYIDVTKRGQSADWEAPLYGSYVIVSQSMTPTIKVKDAIVIKRCNEDEIKIGDVITYKSNDPITEGMMITHRVIEINESNGTKYFITKGDNNSLRDELEVYPYQVYGKVVIRIPKVGYLQEFLATSYGWIFAVLVPSVAIISYDIVKLFQRINHHVRMKKRRKAIIENNEG